MTDTITSTHLPESVYFAEDEDGKVHVFGESEEIPPEYRGRYGPGGENLKEFLQRTIEHMEFITRFWNEKVELARDPKLRNKVFRINGEHYIACDEKERAFRGHGGRRFVIRMLKSGKIIRSSNLWYQGKVPASYRSLLPDNAEFITKE